METRRDWGSMYVGIGVVVMVVLIALAAQSLAVDAFYFEPIRVIPSLGQTLGFWITALLGAVLPVIGFITARRDRALTGTAVFTVYIVLIVIASFALWSRFVN